MAGRLFTHDEGKHLVSFTSIRSSSSVGATSTAAPRRPLRKSPLTVLLNTSASTGSGHIFRMIGRSNLSCGSRS